MSRFEGELCITIDGGTTNTRACLVRGSRVVAKAARGVGVRNVAIEETTVSLQAAVKECIEEILQRSGHSSVDIDLICASGMLTSNVGLREVSHVPVPAGLDELATRVTAASFSEIIPSPIYLVPGVKTRPKGTAIEDLSQLDMMRGEEVEVLGILELTGHRGPLYVVLPGSHTKLLKIDSRNRIVGSYTTLAGELMQALAERTVLASSIEWPASDPPLWNDLEAGTRFVNRYGLLRGGFAVRLADVLTGMSERRCAWFFVGMVVGSDLLDLVRWPDWSDDLRILVGGRQPLRSAYVRVFRANLDRHAEAIEDSVVAVAPSLGAVTVVRRFKELNGIS